MMGTVSLHIDRCRWADEQARLIRTGRTNEVDLPLIAEVLEEMGRSDRRELRSRLAVLLQHLLKWDHQEHRRSQSWVDTVDEQQAELRSLLDESPSLAQFVAAELPKAYREAVRKAAKETKLPSSTFPPESPYTFQEAIEANIEMPDEE
jgi:hypothetical protein